MQQSKRDDLIHTILQECEAGWGISGPDRRQEWQNGWQQTLERFKANPYFKSLRPAYFDKRSGYPLRIDGEWWFGYPGEEWDRYGDMMTRLIRRWFCQWPRIVEFGCGSGHNLVRLDSQQDGAVTGTDFTDASRQCVAAINDKMGRDIEFVEFDMENPSDMRISDAAVLTVTAMEQLNTNFQPFLDFLLHAKPIVVVNVEPLYELYDTGTLFDWVAAKYHRSRGFLRGYLPALQQLEEEGRISILSLKRGWGCLHSDSYSVVVWRPNG